MCGCSFFAKLNDSLSLCPHHLDFSAGIPSSRHGPVAMAIARTHLESVTTVIGHPMSCLMSTALLSSFTVGAGASSIHVGLVLQECTKQESAATRTHNCVSTEKRKGSVREEFV